MSVPPALQLLKRMCAPVLLGFAALLAPTAAAAEMNPLWAAYKARFVTAEGRVVDNGNANVSHSESQGYGLLLAVAHDDRAAFESLWKWTDANLRVRDDRLFAWRWKPASDGQGGGVDDPNNATDGDLLIAWALHRAAAKWNLPAWQTAAAEIAREVRTTMVRRSRLGLLLLPGGTGFEKPEGTIVNLSYWLFPAFRELAAIDPSPTWGHLERSGFELIKKARFSPLDLPPDWLLVGRSKLSPAPGFPAEYGYNAVRVPLHLAWLAPRLPELEAPFQRLGAQPEVRATVKLPSGEPGNDPALPGMLAVYRLAARAEVSAEPVYATSAPHEPYFSVSLGLLANCAAAERIESHKP